MKIKEIHIENFRSIKNETIVMDKNCLILLGKNEAGKSNVLKAIAALFGQYPVTVKDQRKKINNERIQTWRIYMTLEYEEKDVLNIKESLMKKYATIKDITFTGGKSLNDFIQAELPHFIYRIIITNNAKPLLVHTEEKQSDVIPEKELYQNGAVISFQPQGNKIDLRDLLLVEIQKIYSENPYKCIFWHYDNNLLLPDQVAINQFTANPSQYKSLENIFIMCNRTNIAQDFKEAYEQDGDYLNLLDQVSKEVTRVFRKIWKDFKSTSIELTPDGGNILIKVADNAKYSFTDRSDGFKRFISILLNLSTQSRSGKIGERDIIIIDEPDQSLYPTSAKYLKEELLKISEKSRIIYATHSQYMIDSDCLERHLIVEKKNDITTIHKETGVASYSDDELLRNAIGSSIFECIQEKNIIFEGWLDKELFNKYISIVGSNDFKTIGKTFLRGISGAETLVPLLILANKKFVVIADSDKTSVNKRKDFENAFPEYKDCWIAYGDIDNKISTLEDFVNKDIIKKVLKENGEPNYKYNDGLTAIPNIEACSKDKQNIKRKIIESVKGKDDVASSYNNLLDAILKKLDHSVESKCIGSRK
ncbi:MAG: AAA family ATPase [Bacteroidales bacterium]|nr:AAA family ATPase [Bacteroidales bacterium]